MSLCAGEYSMAKGKLCLIQELYCCHLAAVLFGLSGWEQSVVHGE